MEGTPFGRYRLIESIGRGVVGEVWRAYDTVTDRVVAVKVLPAKPFWDDAVPERILREVRAAAQLETPHIVPIYDFGDVDEQLYVSMQLIEGRNLAALLAEGPLDPVRAVRIVDQIGRALDVAHYCGLTHGDIKPSNILLDEQDSACLTDFGIAQISLATRMTTIGGTQAALSYVAPEQVAPQTRGYPAADIYSLACVLYEALTGSSSFTVPNPFSLPPRPSTIQPKLSPQLDQVIATGMSNNPDQRYATAVKLAEAAREAIARPTQQLMPAPTAVASPPPVWPAFPPQPAPTIGATSGGISRGTKFALAAAAAAAVVVIVVAGVIGFTFLGKHQPLQSLPSSTPTSSQQSDEKPVRVTAANLVTKAGTSDPKVVVALYEDFLCPACGNFEKSFHSALDNLVETGDIAADYSFVAILDSSRNQNYSSRAAAAAYCVADESIDAFRRFHTALFSPAIQPSERASNFPDNARLIELAREAGAVGGVPACINSGKYIAKALGMAAATNVQAVPTVRINGKDYVPSTSDALITTAKQLLAQ